RREQIAAGGGVRSVDHARLLLRSGADKVVVNTAIYDQPELVENLGKEFGAQCLVASIDCEHNNGMFVATKKNGFEPTNHTLADAIKICARLPIGEISLNSITRDGTGNGLHLEILDHLPANLSTPLILMGGVGNSKHIVEGLRDSRVDAVATANLLNFMGDGLSRARRNVINEGIDLANFD
ncbi:MAG: HisA/HisF-related TIM barrel protein, partial [Actinomycetota bacterium]